MSTIAFLVACHVMLYLPSVISMYLVYDEINMIDWFNWFLTPCLQAQNAIRADMYLYTSIYNFIRQDWQQNKNGRKNHMTFTTRDTHMHVHT